MQPAGNSTLTDILPAVVERLPVILTEVRELLTDEHPAYASFLTEKFDLVVASAETVAGQLVGPGARARSVAEPGLEQVLFEEVGREHFRHGQELGGLLAAYRAGAGVVWRHVAQLALRLGASSEALAELAATVFTAVDQLSAASRRGYARERSESVLVRERLREELAELLLSGRADAAAIRTAAARADWPLPRRAAVVLVDPEAAAGRAALARLDAGCLRVRGRDLLGAVVPDPGGPRRRTRLATLLRGGQAVVGSTVALDHLPASLHIAEIAVRLRRGRVLDDDPLFVGDHLDALIVHRDEQLLAELRRQLLAPLDGLPAPARERLAATLTSWLLRLGNRQAMAGELHVHPQTVRYRMAQLRELFGAALDDPAQRARLVLALAWGPSVAESDEVDGAPVVPAARTEARLAAVDADGTVPAGCER